MPAHVYPDDGEISDLLISVVEELAALDPESVRREEQEFGVFRGPREWVLLPSSTGTNIKPAPWAEAIRNDQTVKSRKPTRIWTQRGC